MIGKREPNYNFSEVSFTFLYHFCVLLLVLVTFWSILVIFKGSEKIKKSKMMPESKMAVV